MKPADGIGGKTANAIRGFGPHNRQDRPSLTVGVRSPAKPLRNRQQLQVETRLSATQVFHLAAIPVTHYNFATFDQCVARPRVFEGRDHESTT